MLIVILVKKSLKDCFGNIRTTSAGSGILGLMVWSQQFHLLTLRLSLRVTKALQQCALPSHHFLVPRENLLTRSNLKTITMRTKQELWLSLLWMLTLQHSTKWLTDATKNSMNSHGNLCLQGMRVMLKAESTEKISAQRPRQSLVYTKLMPCFGLWV